MMERVFYSIEELKEYLQTVPDGQIVKITVDTRAEEDSCGREEADEE